LNNHYEKQLSLSSIISDFFIRVISSLKCDYLQATGSIVDGEEGTTEIHQSTVSETGGDNSSENQSVGTVTGRKMLLIYFYAYFTSKSLKSMMLKNKIYRNTINFDTGSEI